MKILLLIISLPTETATVRQRVWRSLKAIGAGSLRDGVYVMPGQDAHRAALETVAADVIAGGGTAYVMASEIDDGEPFEGLFDRSGELAALLPEIEAIRHGLGGEPNVASALKQVRKLRRTFTHIAAIDFFPGQAQSQVANALAELEHRVAQLQAPDEPHAASGVIPSLSIKDVRDRVWATRAKPWVDRLASAWLIRRYIDPGATILWLADPQDCPADALGFDFDGATFSHVGDRVTFEVIAAAFGIDQPAIRRLGQVIHFLDIGGLQPPEALGVEGILSGLRGNARDDDALLAEATFVFDGLLAHFEREAAPE